MNTLWTSSADDPGPGRSTHVRGGTVPTSDEQATILLVEDDPTLSTTLAYTLRRAGYRVLTALDGEAGLWLALREANSLDLILLDIMLPKLNGIQVLRQIRTTSDVPVLLLTARGDPQDKVDGLELGADDYVTKPFHMNELVARVRAIVRRRSMTSKRPPAVLTRGPLRIEPERRRAVVNGQEVHLRPKEFGVLLALAMEPGRPFTRTELLDQVWGRDTIVDERTVDVHVSWLRSKLTASGLQAEVIRTTYGMGYSFVVDFEERVPDATP